MPLSNNQAVGGQEEGSKGRQLQSGMCRGGATVDIFLLGDAWACLVRFLRFHTAI